MTAPQQTIFEMARALAGQQRALVFPPDALSKIEVGRMIARELVAGLQGENCHPDLLACHFKIVSGSQDDQVKRGYLRELQQIIERGHA